MKIDKILDIGYITIIYFLFAFCVAFLFDHVMGIYDVEIQNVKSLFQLLIEIICHFWLLGLVCYYIRNLVENINFPLNYYLDLNHKRIKELNAGAIFTFVLFFYQSSLHSKM